MRRELIGFSAESGGDDSGSSDGRGSFVFLLLTAMLDKQIFCKTTLVMIEIGRQGAEKGTDYSTYCSYVSLFLARGRGQSRVVEVFWCVS